MLHPGDLTKDLDDSICRIRPVNRIDGALLARRLWLAQIAEQRHCSLDEAADYERSQLVWGQVWRWVWAGLVGTGLLCLVGLP